MKQLKKVKVVLAVPVTVVFDSEKAKRHALSELKSSLFVEYSTAGIDGFAVAKTGRAKEAKP